MNYTRLTREERYQIKALLDRGSGIREIARQLNRSASSVSREVSKNSLDKCYDASQADQISKSKLHAPQLKSRKIKKVLERYVKSKLLLDWSPEQISGRVRLEKKFKKISHTTIYRYLERDRQQGGVLWKHLRILRKQRKNRKAPQWHPHSFLPNRVSIKKRPKIVEARKRLGDYERDTVLGKRGGSVLLTIVDRTSRLLKLGYLPKSTAKDVHKATLRLLKNRPRHTITNDNGFEFSHHSKTAAALKAAVFFSRSYRAWERGTNENTNGLLRQYFPKKQPINTLSKQQIRAVEKLINTRPRKTLGFKTPQEVDKALRRRMLR